MKRALQQNLTRASQTKGKFHVAIKAKIINT